MTGEIVPQTAISGSSAFALIASTAQRQGFLAKGYCAGILKHMEVKHYRQLILVASGTMGKCMMAEPLSLKPLLQLPRAV